MISAPSQSEVDKLSILKTTVLTLHHLHAKIMSISKNLLGLGAVITAVFGSQNNTAEIPILTMYS